MTKVDRVDCDICEETISRGRWALLRRSLLGRFAVSVLEWGIIDTAPVTSGWRRVRFDLCGDCHDEYIEKVREAVSDD